MCLFFIIFGACWFFAVPLSYIVRLPAYARACDGSWLEVELNGRNYSRRTGVDLAHFSVVATKEALFTFSAPVNSSTFALKGFIAPNSSLVPALDRVQFDYTTNHIHATCYNRTTFGTPCGMEGYVWPYDGLEFGLTFTAPNGSLTTTQSKSRYDYWSFANVPYIILHETSSASGRELGDQILFTSIMKPGKCNLMKVCVSAEAARVRGVVGPDVLVPVGWILEKFGQNSVKCTAPT